jgi:DNA repair photolyase
VKDRPTTNPPIRFRDVTVTYEDGDGPPPAQITLLEDQSRSILSHNDSPDLDFRWSANPYRGCLHSCSYCVDGDTPILMGDGRTRAIRDVTVGDEIYGTRLEREVRTYVRTRVIDHWETRKPAFRITLAEGTQLIASGDHRFLTERGWKHVTAAERPAQRACLTMNNSLVGTGRFASPPSDSDEYRRGYLAGMIRGDALLRRYDYSGRRRPLDVQHQFRLALIDLEALYRTRDYLRQLAIETTEYEFQAERAGYAPVQAIRTHARSHFEQITALIAFPSSPAVDWTKGFLAGIFDAEGSRSAGIFRISNSDRAILDHTLAGMRRFGFDVVEEAPRDVERARPVANIRLRGGLHEHLRFFHLTNPAISRKWDIDGCQVKHPTDLRVVSIEPLPEQQLFDITTGTGDFIANGVVSHNCYARPSHEYLDLGAGTDFDTKIVIKPKAAELLREAFDKPSWKGELVMFSGVTDCYQAIEKDLQLTRQMLEVCLEYRNPVAIISKSALVERDVDLIAELAREAGAHLSVSLTWIDPELARTIEPWAASPARRLKVIETFAKAGVPVGVMCAPVIPGLNDDQLVRVLEAACEAGATSAGWALLRLPGAVKQVFEERLRAALPLAADKVLHRVRETRGGEKLYDPRFHIRGRGQGVYAETIAAMFETACKRLGFNDRNDERAFESRFRRPAKGGQLSLF